MHLGFDKRVDFWGARGDEAGHDGHVDLEAAGEVLGEIGSDFDDEEGGAGATGLGEEATEFDCFVEDVAGFVGGEDGGFFAVSDENGVDHAGGEAGGIVADDSNDGGVFAEATAVVDAF